MRPSFSYHTRNSLSLPEEGRAEQSGTDLEAAGESSRFCDASTQRIVAQREPVECRLDAAGQTAHGITLPLALPWNLRPTSHRFGIESTPDIAFLLANPSAHFGLLKRDSLSRIRPLL